MRTKQKQQQHLPSRLCHNGYDLQPHSNHGSSAQGPVPPRPQAVTLAIRHTPSNKEALRSQQHQSTAMQLAHIYSQLGAAM